jgi:hypothetical protein
MTELPRIKSGFRGRITLHLNDEAPRIGSGVRTVDAHVGSKWVRLTTPIGKTQRIRRKTFDEIYSGSPA